MARKEEWGYCSCLLCLPSCYPSVDLVHKIFTCGKVSHEA